uniref:Uncharacterized protein n=1 Tax=viral metagenome TaxID=1070528 RepID=A0A6M3LQV3_9ZZZZ
MKTECKHKISSTVVKKQRIKDIGSALGRNAENIILTNEYVAGICEKCGKVFPDETINSKD